MEDTRWRTYVFKSKALLRHKVHSMITNLSILKRISCMCSIFFVREYTDMVKDCHQTRNELSKCQISHPSSITIVQLSETMVYSSSSAKRCLKSSTPSLVHFLHRLRLHRNNSLPSRPSSTLPSAACFSSLTLTSFLCCSRIYLPVSFVM